MKLPVELAKPRDFGQIINDTFTFAKQNFKPLMKCLLLFCGIFILAGAIAAAIQQMRMVNTINQINANAYDPDATSSGLSPMAYLGIDYLVVMLLNVLVYVIMMVCILSYIALYKTNGNRIPTTTEVWGYIKYYFLRVFAVSVLQVLVFAGAFGLFMAFGWGSHSLSVIIFGVLVCAALAIWLLPALFIMYPVMVIENTSIRYALSHSFALVKEYWWITFGTLFVSVLITSISRAILVVPVSIAAGVVSVLHSQQGSQMPAGLLVTAGVLQQLCVVLYVIPVITATLCYFNLTEVKEGTSMLERIQHFGEPELPGNTSPDDQF